MPLSALPSPREPEATSVEAEAAPPLSEIAASDVTAQHGRATSADALRRVRVFLLLGATLYPAWGFLLGAPEGGPVYGPEVLWPRLALGVACLVALLASYRAAAVRRHIEPVGLALALSAATVSWHFGSETGWRVIVVASVMVLHFAITTMFSRRRTLAVFVGYGFGLALASGPAGPGEVALGVRVSLLVAVSALGVVAFIERARTRASLRRQALDLAASRAQIHAVLDAIPGYVSWMDPELTYLGVNRGLADALGLAPEQVVGQKMGFRGDGRDPARELVETLFRGDADTLTREVVLPIHGERRDILLSARRYRNGREAILIGLDITTRKQAERQLLSVSKMSALGELSSSIGHEIANPLTVIQSWAERLATLSETGEVDRETVKKAAAKIKKTTARIGQIVRGLKQFARSGDGDPIETTPLSRIVAETVELVQPRYAAKNVQLRVAPVPADVTIDCRPVQICQVLVNLLNNAYDAVEALPARWVELGCEVTPDRVLLHVVDAGKGIPPEIAARLVEPFFTTKPAGVGTGLGLSISRTIARAHGGELAYDPAWPNTRFTLSLARKADGKAPAVEPVE